MKIWKKVILCILSMLLLWISLDLFLPFKTDISRIDASRVSSLEVATWRSYYERKPVKLFFESASLMRKEFHFPFWQSFRAAYYAARAAFVFKKGQSRSEYERAFPFLRNYYGQINRVSTSGFDVDSAARTELEWWIIRREREKHSPAEWEKWLCLTASVMYHVPAERFAGYAHLRVRAMVERDEKGSSITDADWRNIRLLLFQAWQSFAKQL